MTWVRTPTSLASSVDKEESWTSFIVHQKKTPGTDGGAPSGGSKKKGKKGQKEVVDPLLI